MIFDLNVIIILQSVSQIKIVPNNHLLAPKKENLILSKYSIHIRGALFDLILSFFVLIPL